MTSPLGGGAVRRDRPRHILSPLHSGRCLRPGQTAKLCWSPTRSRPPPFSLHPPCPRLSLVRSDSRGDCHVFPTRRSPRAGYRWLQRACSHGSSRGSRTPTASATAPSAGRHPQCTRCNRHQRQTRSSRDPNFSPTTPTSTAGRPITCKVPTGRTRQRRKVRQDVGEDQPRQARILCPGADDLFHRAIDAVADLRELVGQLPRLSSRCAGFAQANSPSADEEGPQGSGTRYVTMSTYNVP